MKRLFLLLAFVLCLVPAAFGAIIVTPGGGGGSGGGATLTQVTNIANTLIGLSNSVKVYVDGTALRAGVPDHAGQISIALDGLLGFPRATTAAAQSNAIVLAASILYYQALNGGNITSHAITAESSDGSPFPFDFLVSGSFADNTLRLRNKSGGFATTSYVSPSDATDTRAFAVGYAPNSGTAPYRNAAYLETNSEGDNTNPAPAILISLFQNDNFGGTQTNNHVRAWFDGSNHVTKFYGWNPLSHLGPLALTIESNGSVSIGSYITSPSFVGSPGWATLSLGASNEVGGIALRSIHDRPVWSTNLWGGTNGTVGQYLKLTATNNNTFTMEWADVSSGSQTPWTANVNGALFWLTNVTEVWSANVLIGTNIPSPVYKLQVNGNAAFGTGGPKSSFNNNGQLTIAIDNGNDYVFRVQTNHMVITNGFVGIGKVNPTVALDVTGAGAFTGNMTVGGFGQFTGLLAGDSSLGIRAAIDGRYTFNGGSFPSLHTEGGTTNLIVGANGARSQSIALLASGGVGSSKTNTPTAIGTTGWTNNLPNAVNAKVQFDGVGVTYTLYQNNGTPWYTNSAVVGHGDCDLQFGEKVLFTAGTGITGVAVPW